MGRLIMFKECLKHNIVPFIITEELKMYYYHEIKNWKNERGYLRDTCFTGQDEGKVGKWRAVFVGAVFFIEIEGGFSCAEDAVDF